MPKGLVIVESPTKARTIGHYLGKDFIVKATMGHIRDLPEGSFGVDLGTFAPVYEVLSRQKKTAATLKQLASQFEDIYLATDEDREGEAIAWHAAHVMGKDPALLKRVAFHEITPQAIKKSFANPRSIDRALVDAQQARRVLDRIVGYTLSPLLKKNFKLALSAGRVQSVALRLIVEREKEIEKFVPKAYWNITVLVEKSGGEFTFSLVSIDGKKLDAAQPDDEERVHKIVKELTDGKVITVSEVARKERAVRPYPPFITSTLQQEANIRFAFSSAKTMQIAQTLYEGVPIGKKSPVGLITYMRTDSPSVARPAQQKAFQVIKDTFGPEYVPDRPPTYRARVSNAQEAHEAIRPTDVTLSPNSIKEYLSADQYKLYTLIWDRFIASQMKPAIVDETVITGISGIYGLTAKTATIVFPGFTKVWPSAIDTGQILPAVPEEAESLLVKEVVSEKKMTKPPFRYTEASLIKNLEKFGIGRPSTYAPTLGTLLRRKYVRYEKKSLVPTELGVMVIEVLVKYFDTTVSVGFTADLEKKLDRIAEGATEWVGILNTFYQEFKPALDKAQEDIVPIDLPKKPPALPSGKQCPQCGKDLLIRKSRFGEFLGCAGFPKCRYTERLPGEKKEKKSDKEKGEK
ncbi:MAG: type I DNA topoisomerase [Candidatus Ratteibacteria bacterium]